MQLDDDQLAEFEERGYLLSPGLLDGDEVAVLQKAMPVTLRHQGPEVVREKEDPTRGPAGLRSACLFRTVPLSLAASTPVEPSAPVVEG